MPSLSSIRNQSSSNSGPGPGHRPNLSPSQSRHGRHRTHHFKFKSDVIHFGSSELSTASSVSSQLTQHGTLESESGQLSLSLVEMAPFTRSQVSSAVMARNEASPAEMEPLVRVCGPLYHPSENEVIEFGSEFGDGRILTTSTCQNSHVIRLGSPERPRPSLSSAQPIFVIHPYPVVREFRLSIIHRPGPLFPHRSDVDSG